MRRTSLALSLLAGLAWALAATSPARAATDERIEDIPVLAERFLADISEQWSGDAAPEISPEAMDALQSHHYTGNVRELINILQRAMTMSDGKVITPEDLMLEHIEVGESGGGAPAPSADDVKGEDESLDDYIENIEKKMLEDALKKAKYNKTRAAEMLGISFRSFRYKLKKFEID